MSAFWLSLFNNDLFLEFEMPLSEVMLSVKVKVDFLAVETKIKILMNFKGSKKL